MKTEYQKAKEKFEEMEELLEKRIAFGIRTFYAICIIGLIILLIKLC